MNGETDWDGKRAQAKMNFWIWATVSTVALTLAAAVYELGWGCLAAPFLFVWFCSGFMAVGFIYAQTMINESEEKENKRLEKMQKIDKTMGK